MPHAESPNPPSSPPVDDIVMEEPASGALDEQAELQNEATQSSPAPAVNEVEKASLEDMKPGNTNVGKDAEVLRAFYQRLFPFKYLFQWLNHSPTTTTDFSNRELAFVLPNDAYIRYQSFNSAEELRKQCIQLTPTRFEIGPVYSANPRDRKTLRNASAFRPLAKELVFDIDMTDYDEIRTCCSGASICQKCWQFITMAIKVIDKALRDDFGFKHIMWVYSGRRGAHAWISDKRARDMDDNKRRSIAGYLDLLKGGDKTGKKVNLKRPLHPHMDLKILNGYFQTDVLLEQDPWASPEKATHLLQLLPDKSLTAALQRKWDSTPHRSSTQKWADIDAVASVSGSLSSLTPETLVHAKQDIRLEYTYPRLDAEVSKKLNHLLKSPFVIHPGTGRVCVPIDVRRFEEFEPEKVPTVQQLLSEIDSWQGTDDKIQDWQKTSLKPYIELFRDHVNAIMKEERAAEKRGREESGEGVEF
ncbi:unnamed protein product [Aureobasidium uvarum]|uniref:DNA primase n=1 Tax=Aureobasidium uvarum TaxID=2773716 RepID=A0A9N8PQ88_9PEZI|nr:unnamed protein product [Aureobasidium uvarum]